MQRRILSILVITLLGLMLVACGAESSPAETADVAAEAPAQTAAEASEPAAAPGSYNEAPQLAELVAAGELPPVEERLPLQPLVITPRDEIGQYGGEQRGAAFGPQIGQLDTEALRMQSLLFIEPDLVSLSPNILLDYEFSEDFRTWTLYLREGMKWSDGEPFTADDFMFWYEDHLLNPELVPAIPLVYISGGEPMVMTKIDDYTLQVDFAEPNPNFDLTMSKSHSHDRMYAPRHYLEQWHIDYNPEADALAQSEGFENWTLAFLHHKMHTQGQQDTNLPDITPWVLDSIDELGNKYFERNPYYWAVDTAGNQLPYIDRQIAVMVNDAQVRTLKFINRELDNAGENPLPVSDYPLYVENEEAGDYRVFLFDNSRGNDVGITFNQTHSDPVLKEIFNDVRFRQAMSLAINRTQINDILYFGRALVRQATIPDSVSFYEDWMGEYFIEFDVDQANALLDEMGLEWNAAGDTRMRPDGRPLELVLECWTEFCPHSELVAEMWSENLGIPTQMNQIERSLWLERHEANEQDVFAHPYDAIAEPNLRAGNCSRLRATATGSGGYGPLWRVWFNTQGAQGEEPSQVAKDIMALCDRYASALPGSDEYMEIGREMATLYTEQLYTLGVSVAPRVIIISNRLGNAPTEGMFAGDYSFWVPYRGDQWYIKY
jgi:peptide/nickel transport system substrate-binding protein